MHIVVNKMNMLTLSGYVCIFCLSSEYVMYTITKRHVTLLLQIAINQP